MRKSIRLTLNISNILDAQERGFVMMTNPPFLFGYMSISGFTSESLRITGAALRSQ